MCRDEDIERTYIVKDDMCATWLDKYECRLCQMHVNSPVQKPIQKRLITNFTDKRREYHFLYLFVRLYLSVESDNSSDAEDSSAVLHDLYAVMWPMLRKTPAVKRVYLRLIKTLPLKDGGNSFF